MAKNGQNTAITAFKQAKMTGTIKWYNASRGVGFIHAPDGHGDIFIVRDQIHPADQKTLTEGQAVSFDGTGKRPSGCVIALNVRSV